MGDAVTRLGTPDAHEAATAALYGALRATMGVCVTEVGDLEDARLRQWADHHLTYPRVHDGDSGHVLHDLPWEVLWCFQRQDTHTRPAAPDVAFAQAVTQLADKSLRSPRQLPADIRLADALDAHPLAGGPGPAVVDVLTGAWEHRLRAVCEQALQTWRASLSPFLTHEHPYVRVLVTLGADPAGSLASTFRDWRDPVVVTGTVTAMRRTGVAVLVHPNEAQAVLADEDMSLYDPELVTTDGLTAARLDYAQRLTEAAGGFTPGRVADPLACLGHALEVAADALGEDLEVPTAQADGGVEATHEQLRVRLRERLQAAGRGRR